MKVQEIFETIGISHITVDTIFNEKLSMKKPSARWVPHLLTVKNKPNRVTNSMANLALFRRNCSEFLRRYITVDEMCIHFYMTETKEQWK